MRALGMKAHSAASVGWFAAEVGLVRAAGRQLGRLLMLAGLLPALAWGGDFIATLDRLPPDWQGERFQLRTDWPQQKPDSPRPWEAIDVRHHPRAYVQALKDYVYAGMAEVDFVPRKNHVHAWYHMPWHHLGRRAREAVHGLSRQRDVKPFELGPTQSEPQQKWELVFFNDMMAWQQGRIWQGGRPHLEHAELPPGSLVVKYVFVTGDDTQLPMLKGAPTWQAHINCTIRRDERRCIRPVRLIQMDIAVRDEQVKDTTSWVMTTLVYDRDAPGRTGWDRMVPLGVQWGNDPGVTPADIARGAKLKETVIFADAPKYAMERLGWAGRLNGPTDLKGSACLSCHSTASWPDPPRFTPPKGADDTTRLKWFRNLKPDEPFLPGRVSLDYSLHLENALKNFYHANPSEGDD